MLHVICFCIFLSDLLVTINKKVALSFISFENHIYLYKYTILLHAVFFVLLHAISLHNFVAAELIFLFFGADCSTSLHAHIWIMPCNICIIIRNICCTCYLI